MSSEKAMRKALRALEAVQFGSLRLKTPSGDVLNFGAGAPAAELHVRDWSVFSALLTRGDVGFGETYVEGLWDSPDIETLVAFAFDVANRPALQKFLYGAFVAQNMFRFSDVFLRANSRSGSRRNIRAHYDVGNDFYRLWLDESMTYSSALFDGDADALAAAQKRKYERMLHISRAQGARTLEIGCGWGGFAERAAEEGRDVTAITVSPSQHAFALARLGGKADVRLQDYRDVDGKFDSVVSIEMIEAVGERYWPNYFRVIKQRLADGGRAAIQAIVVSDADFPSYKSRSDYIRRHVFPGGMLLSPGRISAEAARAGLKVESEFSFGADYARTLRHWLQAFEKARDAIAKLGHSDAFVRSWRFYLASCAGLFQAGRTNVMQVELTHA
jgi:cyclopropane-fatty-acyl-phospholipid synthase